MKKCLHCGEMNSNHGMTCQACGRAMPGYEQIEGAKFIQAPAWEVRLALAIVQVQSFWAWFAATVRRMLGM